MKDVRQKMASISGANITIGQPIGHRIDHMLSGTRANIAIKIFGTDLGTLQNLSNEVKKSIEGIEGMVDLNSEPQIQIPQIQIKANRSMLGKYGITIGEFAEFTDVAFAGEKVSEVYEENKRFDLILRFDEDNRGKMEHIKNTLIDAGDGQKIPLSYVAEVVSTLGPNTINRENVQRKTVVSANVAGRDQKSVVDEMRTKIETEVKLPEGYRIEYGGQFEAEKEASRTLVLTSILALLVIFFLLYQEFKTVKISTIILLNLPLALIGGVLSVWLTSGRLSIPAIIGFITLFGIATRNGILLVSHYQMLQKQGMALKDTIINGSKDRLSAILMTALTAGLALIPLAMGGDLPGNEIQSPMAKVILGGLLSSTLLNLFVVPIVYYLANNKTEIK
jgi:Cu/Ag efflux pump CusA